MSRVEAVGGGARVGLSGVLGSSRDLIIGRRCTQH